MEDLFADTAYLAAGNERQRSAYRVLTELGLLERLASFNPILVGTVPLGIDIPDSDLDVAHPCTYSCIRVPPSLHRQTKSTFPRTGRCFCRLLSSCT